MAKPPSEEQRRILALSFELGPDGNVYYRNAWSRGIPVSEAEREAYLSIPALGSRRLWLNAIAGRPSVPRRAYWPTAFKLLAAMPARSGYTFLGFGSLAVYLGLHGDAGILEINATLVGTMLFAIGLVVLSGRLRNARKN